MPAGNSIHFILFLQCRHTSHLNQRSAFMFNIISCDRNFADAVIFRDLIHDIQHEIFDDRSQCPRSGFFLQSFLCDRLQCSILKNKLHFIKCQQFLLLLEDGTFRLFEDHDQHLFCQSPQCKDDRQSSDKFRDHAEIADIFQCHFFEDIRIVVILVL